MTEEYIQEIIDEAKKSGKIKHHQVEGLSDDELRLVIKSVMGESPTFIKAIVYDGMKKNT